MNESLNGKGFWGYFIDVATIVSMLVLFSKTMEVMAAISPLTLFGVGGLAYIYGATVAVLIEGSIIAISFVPAFRSNPAAQAYKWTLFGISAFCQFMDKEIVIDGMASTSAYSQLRIGLTYAIPVIIALGLIILAQANQKTEKALPWKGVKNMFGGKWDKFMNGDTVSSFPTPMATNAFDVPQVELEDGETETKPTPERKVRHE